IGLAFDMVWGGSLANVTAGVLMAVLRPFRVGDLIEAGGVLGRVVGVGPLALKINTLDNVLTSVGNSKIFSDHFQNCSKNALRRVDLFLQLDQDADVAEVSRQLKARLAQIPNVLPQPAPLVETLECNRIGPKLAVRPFCNNTDYWQVYFETNRV